MNKITLNGEQLKEYLLTIAPIRPIFVQGPPGIGKSAIIEEFGKDVGMEVVSLLGTNLLPEDLIGIPKIKKFEDGLECSEFFPPRLIMRKIPFILFLDELNASSTEVQKAFYSLIHEQKIGNYQLPKGSIIIGAGNRIEDKAIVKNMSSALINRMCIVEMKASHKEWLKWAYKNDLHSWVINYIENRPDHLYHKPTKGNTPFSSPRSWHMLSDQLKNYDDKLKNGTEEEVGNILNICSFSTLSESHAAQFISFTKKIKRNLNIKKLLKGEITWPRKPEDRDILQFLVESLKIYLIKNLPKQDNKIKSHQKEEIHLIKKLIGDLTKISDELAKMLLTTPSHDGENLPNWFKTELIKDLPQLIL